jgi:predicted ribonuclease YlaK
MLKIVTIESDPSTINKVYKQRRLMLTDMTEPEQAVWDDVYEGFYILRSEATGQSALVLFWGSRELIELVDTKGLAFRGLEPRDAAQSCLFHSIKTRQLTVGLGEAGTGKTTIALAYAINAIYKQNMNVVLCKPTVFVGMKSNAIAPVPGDHREKMAGYIESYMTAFRRLFGDTFEHHISELEEQGRIIFQPLELVRGMQFENSVVIIDEAQNTSPHELMSVLSRINETCKTIILGDACQIDTRLPFAETGLGVLVESRAFAECGFAAGIMLTTNYRGPMALLAAEVLREHMGQND